MNGYTGWFSKVFTADSLAAGTYDLTSICTTVNPGDGSVIYADTHSGVNRAECQFVWEVTLLRNTGSATIVPTWTNGNSYAATAKYDNGLTAGLPLGNYRKYLENFSDNTATSDGVGARLVVASTGNYSFRVRVRPYHMSGWTNAGLTGAAALTYIDPGITNTALGRAATYANEIKQAKDLIYSRIVAAGIDPNEIPTDGVKDYSNGSAPQAYANYLIPELIDAATYLAVSLVYERFVQMPDDMNAVRREMFKDKYEVAMAEALKNLPLNLNNDYVLGSDEETVGQPSLLVR